MSNQNLFVALRNAFPADLDTLAVETDEGLRYSWRDLDRATAMVANLLQSLDIPQSNDGVKQDKKPPFPELYTIKKPVIKDRFFLSSILFS